MGYQVQKNDAYFGVSRGINMSCTLFECSHPVISIPGRLMSGCLLLQESIKSDSELESCRSSDSGLERERERDGELASCYRNLAERDTDLVGRKKYAKAQRASL